MNSIDGDSLVVDIEVVVDDVGALQVFYSVLQAVQLVLDLSHGVTVSGGCLLVVVMVIIMVIMLVSHEGATLIVVMFLLNDMDFSLLRGAVAVVMVRCVLFFMLWLLLLDCVVARSVRPFVGAVVVSVRVSLRCRGDGGSLLHLFLLLFHRLLLFGGFGHVVMLTFVAWGVRVRARLSEGRETWFQVLLVAARGSGGGCMLLLTITSTELEVGEIEVPSSNRSGKEGGGDKFHLY